jgi:hypothetical protein
LKDTPSAPRQQTGARPQRGRATLKRTACHSFKGRTRALFRPKARARAAKAREIFIAPERPLLHAARDSSEEIALKVKRAKASREHACDI